MYQKLTYPNNECLKGGLGVTLFTGGIGAVVVAGALFGSGTTLAASPLVKIANKECITLKDSVKDAAIGGTVGAVTGPVGNYLSSFAKGASVGTRISIHIASGSSGGAIKGTVTEGAKVVTGGEFSGMEFTKAVIFGGAVGGVCGAAQPIAHSRLLSPVTDVISKPAMRLLSSTGLSTASNVVVDVVKDGDVNGKVLAAKVVGSLITSSTKECNKACKSSKQQG